MSDPRFGDRPELQMRMWRVQRVCWLICLAMILAAAVGVTGDGPMGRVTAAFGRAGSLDYHRFTRLDAETTLVFTQDAANGKGQVEIGVDDLFQRTVRVNSFEPPPAHSRLVDGGWMFTFNTDGSPGGRVRWNVSPLQAGWFRCSALLNGERAEIAQFVWP